MEQTLWPVSVIYEKKKIYLFIYLYCFPKYEHRYLGKNDSVTITVWNQKKVHKKQGAGFLGCVKIMPTLIQSLKDTGCK